MNNIILVPARRSGKLLAMWKCFTDRMIEEMIKNNRTAKNRKYITKYYVSARLYEQICNRSKEFGCLKVKSHLYYVGEGNKRVYLAKIVPDDNKQKGSMKDNDFIRFHFDGVPQNLSEEFQRVVRGDNHSQHDDMVASLDSAKLFYNWEEDK